MGLDGSGMVSRFWMSQIDSSLSKVVYFNLSRKSIA